MYNGLIKKMLGGMHMKLEFLGAAHEVTGSCHYLEFADKHATGGLRYGTGTGSVCQSGDSGGTPVDDRGYVFVTHAHIDHSGQCCRLLYQIMASAGQIFTTDGDTGSAVRDYASRTARISRCLRRSGRTARPKRAGRAGGSYRSYDMNDAGGGIWDILCRCDLPQA